MENFCLCGCGVSIPFGRKYVHGHNFNKQFAQYARSKSKGHLGCKHTGDFSRFGKHRIGVKPINAFEKGTHISSKTEFKKGHIPFNKGKPHLVRENNPNWKGGIIPEQNALRQTYKYKNWRKAVFERDNYTCRECGAKSSKNNKVYLEPHHIKPFALYPELRFEVFNGLTLCYDCHQKTKKPIK